MPFTWIKRQYQLLKLKQGLSQWVIDSGYPIGDKYQIFRTNDMLVKLEQYINDKYPLVDYCTTRNWDKQLNSILYPIVTNTEVFDYDTLLITHWYGGMHSIIPVQIKYQIGGGFTDPIR